jgi:hypothetical protein
VRDANVGGGKKERHCQDDESIKTPFYVCIVFGFHSLDDPGLQGKLVLS